MENKDFAMLVIALVVLFIAGSGNMTMLTPSHTVTAYPGETIDIEWAFIYDDSSFFGTSTSAAVIQDEYQFGGPDVTVWSGTVSAGNTYSGSYKYKVPTEPGTYKINYRAEFKGTTSGRFTLTIEVGGSPPVSTPAPTPTPTPTFTESQDGSAAYGNVDAVILDGSLWDKLRMIVSLILLYISNSLSGGG